MPAPRRLLVVRRAQPRQATDLVLGDRLQYLSSGNRIQLVQLSQDRIFCRFHLCLAMPEEDAETEAGETHGDQPIDRISVASQDID